MAEKDWVKWRLDTALSKEVETIAWIDEMQPGEVLYDIGASIGIYTTYAAKRGVRVVSFEPHIHTAKVLIERTQGYKDVVVLPVALGEATHIAPVYYKSNLPGTSGHQTDTPVDEHGERFEPSYVVNGLVFALDDIPGLPKPDFIKLDTDGAELSILWGAASTLRSVQGILLETNPNSRHCLELLMSWGFVMNDKINNHPQHSKYRRAQEAGNVAENWALMRA